MPGKEGALKILKASLEGALCDLSEHLIQTDFGFETDKMLYSLRQNQFPSLLGPSDSIKTCSSDWAWFRNFFHHENYTYSQTIVAVCLPTHTHTYSDESIQYLVDISLFGTDLE